MLKLNKIKNARNPNIDTLIMIENTLSKNKNLTIRKLWLKLPKKVMWQTFLLALDYLEKTKQIEKKENLLIQKNIPLPKSKQDEIPSIPPYVY